MRARMAARRPQREPSKTARRVTATTRLQVGMPVQFERSKYFIHSARVVSLETNGQIKIGLEGYDDAFDEVVPRSKLWVEPSELKAAARDGDSKTVVPAVAGTRTWTDASGKFKVEAELISFEDGIVRLRRKDGKELSMPLEKLSDEDQQLLENSE